MRLVALALTVLLALPLAADAIDEVRQAETGFAKAFADRDKTRFFSYVADDAVFISPLGTLRGKQQVIDRWSRFFDGVAVAPFRWGPERVEVAAGGSVGFSMGPIYDPKGEHAGYYSSIWQKQGNGSWKVVFDGPGSPPAPLAVNAAPFEEGMVTAADGAKLYYRKIGRGPVTLIAPLDYVLFDELKQFADIATVITYDMRNRGRSSRLESVDTVSIGQDARDLESVRDHFKIEKFVPVGYSYLGKMVMLYAVAHPDRVTRIVQMGPLGNRPEKVDGPAAKDFGAPVEDMEKWDKMRADAGTAPRDLCMQQWKVLSYFMVGDPKNAANFEYEEMCGLENEWPVNVNKTFAKLLSGPPVALTDEELSTIKAPVLTIHGTKDRNAPYPGGRAWAAALPDARLVTIEGGAHAMWVDDPVTTFGAIRHFLRGDWPLGSEKVTAK